MSGPTVFELRAPIKAFGDEVRQLQLREPTTADARAINSLPYVFSQAGGGVPTVVPDVCAKYISRLADIPLSSVDQLVLGDFHALAWEVVNYFLQQLAPAQSQDSSITPSALPTSGD